MNRIGLSFGVTLGYRVAKISSQILTIIPRLNIEIELIPFDLNPNDKLYLSNFIGRAYSTINNNEIYIGDVTTDIVRLECSGNGPYRPSFFLTIDYFILSQIEKMGGGSSLPLKFRINFISNFSKDAQLIQLQGGFEDNYTIPKSDWVEKFLLDFKYKQVSLVEIPQVYGEEFKNVAQYLNEAWKQFAMGEYGKVLMDCQKALEEAKKLIIERGFDKSPNGKKEIDFSKLGCNDTVAEALDSILRKLILFLQPGGRHIGTARAREDAEFAILSTQGLLNLLIKRVAE